MNGVMLRDHFSRLYNLTSDKNVIVVDMMLNDGDESEFRQSWKHKLFQWKDELNVKCFFLQTCVNQCLQLPRIISTPIFLLFIVWNSVMIQLDIVCLSCQILWWNRLKKYWIKRNYRQILQVDIIRFTKLISPKIFIKNATQKLNLSFNFSFLSFFQKLIHILYLKISNTTNY